MKERMLRLCAEQCKKFFVFEDSQHQNSANFCLWHGLRTATPQQLNRAIADLASQMKNRRLEVADLSEEPLDRFGEDAVV